jgi:hypothetical protein
MRFPSPANGADEMVSCFCPHCRRAAADAGLDLAAVVRVFRERSLGGEVRTGARVARDQVCTDALLTEASIVQSFLRFRSNCITQLVAEASAVARALGRKVALDLFSPNLATIVGQDYRQLRAYADWVKPMIYRVARGPASLRLEVPALIANLAQLSGVGAAEVAAWCASGIAALGGDALETIERTGVPFDVVRDEIGIAIRDLDPVPVYFGLEMISYPGAIEITPSDVIGAVGAGRAADAAGAILSWDLMHAPPDGLRALAEAL